MLYVDLYIFSLVVLIASLPRDISKVSKGHECRRPSVTGNIREGQGFQQSGLFRLKWQGTTKMEVATVKKTQCVKCKYKFQDFSNQMCCTAAQSFISCWNLLSRKRTKFQIPLHILSTLSWISLQRSMEMICMQDEWLTVDWSEHTECFSVDAAVPSVLKVAEMWTVGLWKTTGEQRFSGIYHCYSQFLLSCAEL